MKNKRIIFGENGPIIPSEFARYFLISLVALFADLCTFSLLFRLAGLHWFMAVGIGFCVGGFLAWWLSIKFVFNSRILNKSPFFEFAIFFFIGLVGLVINEMSIWGSIHLFGLVPELGKLLASGLTFVFNFVIRKIFLFRKVSVT